jgi:hypothetical protein
MQGLMMDYPLTLQHFFNRAVRIFARKEIVLDWYVECA